MEQKRKPRKTMQVKIAQVYGLPSDYFFNVTATTADVAEELISKISKVMYGTENNISDEKKRLCKDAIQEIMDIKK